MSESMFFNTLGKVSCEQTENPSSTEQERKKSPGEVSYRWIQIILFSFHETTPAPATLANLSGSSWAHGGSVFWLLLLLHHHHLHLGPTAVASLFCYLERGADWFWNPW